MLDPWQLRTFLAVADSLSFRQAAKALHLAPSTVTAQIKALEEALGVRLFARRPGNTTLTEHGRRLTGLARRLLDLEAEVRRDMGRDGEACPELAVRLPETLALGIAPAVLTAFRRRYPHTRLLLATHSRLGLARELRQGSLDLGLLLGEPFAAEGVVMEEIHCEPLCVIAAPHAPEAALGAIGPQALAGRELFVTRHIWSARRRVDAALERAGTRLGAVTECTSLAVVKRCVAAGRGLALAPWLAVREEHAAGTLAALRWEGEALAAPVLLLRREGAPQNPAADAFCDAVRRALAALPPPPQFLAVGDSPPDPPQ